MYSTNAEDDHDSKIPHPQSVATNRKEDLPISIATSPMMTLGNIIYLHQIHHPLRIHGNLFAETISTIAASAKAPNRTIHNTTHMHIPLPPLLPGIRLIM